LILVDERTYNWNHIELSGQSQYVLLGIRGEISHGSAYTTDNSVAARENTPAMMVVAVVNFSPVPPAMVSPFRCGAPMSSDQGARCLFRRSRADIDEVALSTVILYGVELEASFLT
jgi:hypothetical protein